MYKNIFKRDTYKLSIFKKTDTCNSINCYWCTLLIILEHFFYLFGIYYFVELQGGLI